MYRVKNVRFFLQELLKQNLVEEDNEQQIKELVKKTHLNGALLKGLYKKNKEEHEIIAECQILQQAFSHLFLYSRFLIYVQYLANFDDAPIYFVPYSDFRGRLYYKSEATPQSI